jgi:hypothetical protein
LPARVLLAAEAALGPAEAEPAFHGDATPSPICERFADSSAHDDATNHQHAGELVLTAAACPPVEAPPAQPDDGKPADRPRGKRRRGKGKADAAAAGNGEAG